MKLLYLDSFKFEEIEIKMELELRFLNKDIFESTVLNKLEI